MNMENDIKKIMKKEIIELIEEKYERLLFALYDDESEQEHDLKILKKMLSDIKKAI